MTDLHSHAIPGLDDGASTLEESLRMLDEWITLGYNKIITTPHVSLNWYPNTRERILGQYYALLEVIEEKNLPIQLEVGAEYKIEPTLINRAVTEELLSFGHQKYLLVELPWREPVNPVGDLLPVIETLLDMQYQLILAHPERQDWIHRSKLNMSTMRDLGVSFQLNLLSLTGRYGKQTKKTAEKFIRESWYSFTGTDAHDSQDLREISQVMKTKSYRKLMESGMIKNNEL